MALFPSRCPYCNKVIPDTECACKSCRGQFPEVCCTRYAIGGFLCASPFSYNGVYAKAVKKLKFHNRGDLAKPLAMQIVRAVSEIHGELRFDRWEQSIVFADPEQEKIAEAFENRNGIG